MTWNNAARGLIAVGLVLAAGCVDQSESPTSDGGVDRQYVPGGGRGGAGGSYSCEAPADAGAPMRDISSAELVRQMGLGWNLGNSLDAVGSETSWGNPVITQDLILAVKAAGFSSIRIPVTWRGHFETAPTYTIDATWMDRVQQVVDWTLDAGLYAIINMHHDGGADTTKGAWIRTASTDYDGFMTQYKALWSQIADRFKDHGDYLVLESMNEVGFDDLKANNGPSQAAYDLLNKINGEFVQLIRASGGNNCRRHLLLAGYYTDIDQSVRGVIMPGDERTILSIHFYTPSSFCINGNPTTWGAATEITLVQRLFDKLKAAFIDRGVPVILGEYGAVNKTEPSSRVFWIEHVAKACRDRGIASYLWDNGSELNRKTLTWDTPGLLDALHRVASGDEYAITKN